ncbi:unnamed protein product [Effrenium voratum]|nr:unnamed protein product [Effrenium voratum]
MFQTTRIAHAGIDLKTPSQAHQSHHTLPARLRFRTDMFLPGPIDLAQFPEVWTSRVIYGFTDIAFLCRRDVAHSLLANVTGKLTQFAGNQRTLVFLDYRRLLRNGWGDGFRLQTFPDASPALKRAVFAGEGRAVLAAVRRHLTALEAAHQDAARGLPVATFSGHWRRGFQVCLGLGQPRPSLRQPSRDGGKEVWKSTEPKKITRGMRQCKA